MMNTWHNLSLRLRLTLLYVGLFTLIASMLSGLLYWDTTHFLLNATATRLRAQAKPVIEHWLYDDAASAVDLSRIADPLAQDLTSRDTVALVLDREGRVIANGKRLPEEPDSPAPTPSFYLRALAGENEVNYQTTLHGQRMLVLLIPLRRTPASPEILGVVQLSAPLTAVDQILLRQRVLLGIGIALTMLIGALLGLWLTTSALKPLHRMLVTCRRIADGDLGQRVNLPHRHDEVGQLAHAFDDMVGFLEATIEAQRRFVANAAHELRTPLTALQGSLEVLLRGSQDDPAAAARLIQGMYREVTRLTRLSEQLLDLTRINTSTTVHKVPTPLQNFFEEFIQQVRLLARDHEVVLEAGPSITILVDPDALKEILFNLVDNAMQHTENGGVISLGWRLSVDDVTLWVVDTGEGIAEEDLPHIFEPFYRGDRSRSRRRGGSGLGLSLARSLIMAHGGRISVESRPGHGARFTIILPID